MCLSLTQNEFLKISLGEVANDNDFVRWFNCKEVDMFWNRD